MGLAGQHQRHAAMLGGYIQRLHSGTSFVEAPHDKPRWIVGQDCSGLFLPLSCNEVCTTVNGTCWLDAMKTLTSQGAVSQATAAAGHYCNKFEIHQVKDSPWDGP